MTRSEAVVVAIFIVVVAAWLTVHGLHARKPAPVQPGAATQTHS